MLVFLPVNLAMHLAPSIFPLDITIFDPVTEIPADIIVFQICIPFAMKHFKPRATVKALLRRWFTAVGWALGLTEFLLPRPEENGRQENGNVEVLRRERLHDARQVLGPHRPPLAQIIAAENHDRRGLAIGHTDVDEESDVDDQSDSEYGFVLRIVLLLVLAWMTLLLFNATLIVLPISVGRVIFNSIPRLPFTHGIKCNDFVAFSIGSYFIWAIVAGASYSAEYIRSRGARLLVSQILKWCIIILKSSALLSLWIIVIPVLVGLLIELLVLVPWIVPVDESPVFLLYRDWAIGLIAMKCWTKLHMMDQMAPLVDESWRAKFVRVREDGFSGLRGFWILHEIAIPIIVKLLTALCVPYVFAKGVFPVFGYPLIVNSAVYRYAWLGCLFFSMLCFCAKRFRVWFMNLHNAIRDDRYLIGRRLHDFGEDEAASKGNEVSTTDAMGSDGVDTGLRLRHANQRANL